MATAINLIRDSTYTLAANVIGQTFGIIYFLVVPNILSTKAYAMTIYINLLLYYGGFTSLGLINVYARKAPGMLEKGLEKEVVIMEDSIQLLWHILTLLYSILAASFVYHKYGLLFYAITVAIIINLAPFTSMYLQKKTVRGGFKIYRNITIFQSLSNFLVILGVYIRSLVGWLVGTIMSMITLFIYTRDKNICRINWKAHPLLFKKYIPEGIVLISVTIIWGTLLMLGRVQAAAINSDKVLAIYGIVSSVFQMLATAIVSICLPVTVEIYALSAVDKKKLFWFIFKLQTIMVTAVTTLAIILSDFIPFLLPMVFRGYSFNVVMIKLMMLSLISLPFLATCGSILIAGEMSIRYLFTLGSILMASFIFIYSTSKIFFDLTAAISQFIFLNLSAISLIILVWYSFVKHSFVSFLVMHIPVFLVMLITIVVYVIKFLAKFIVPFEITRFLIVDSILIFFVALSGLYIWVNRRMLDNYKDSYLGLLGIT